MPLRGKSACHCGVGICKLRERMSLPSEDWQKINACLLRLYRELDTEKHTQVMLEILRELVPGDSLGLSIYCPQESFKFISLPENMASEATLQESLQFIHESPFGSYYLATQDASWKLASDFLPTEDYHETQWYLRYLKPVGINYQISGILAVIEGTAHLLTINRTHANFTEPERELLNALHPHLVTSHVNALVFSGAQKSISQLKTVMETAPGAYGYFDANGRVVWMQDKAEAWLAEFFPGEVKNQNKIPHSVQSLLTQSQAKGTPEHLETQTTTERLAVMISASPLGGSILRLQREPKTPLPRFRSLAQLTPAENDVLRWMAEGKRNAEIGTILGISPRTVEKHVAQVLTKLAVENRATAIIRSMELCAAANMTAG
jgi:DNA-binding CsgD family transcriptional regulator